MHGLHSELGWTGWMMALTLELMFILICVVLIGFGRSELKKGKAIFKNTLIVGMGFVLAAVSLYVTKLLVQG